MSKLYGMMTSDASKTESTKRGHKRLHVYAATWKGCIQVNIYLDADGNECYSISREAWQGNGSEHAGPIAHGKF